MHLPQHAGRVENQAFAGATWEIIYETISGGSCKTVAWAENEAAAEAAVTALRRECTASERQAVRYYAQPA